MIVVVLALTGFALTAALGLWGARVLCDGIAPLADGPPAGNAHARIVVAVAALLGAAAAARGLGAAPLALFALVCGLLAAIWYADIMRGIVPDIFTVVPLGALGVAALAAHRPEVIAAAIVPAIPFVVMAALTRGRGLGWGDAKLAALGGALVGMQPAVLLFGCASLAAIVVSRVRGRRARPIAFAPYLVIAIMIPLALKAGM